MEVGAADAAGADREQNLARARDWVGKLGRPQRTSGRLQHHRAHAASLGAMGLRGRALAAGACVLCAAISAGIAAGEVGTKNGIPPSVRGSIAPVKLPRDRFAAVGLQFGFKVGTRAEGPSLADLELELSRNLEIDAEAVPSCGVRRLSETTEAEAKRDCRKSVVGHGFVSAHRTESSGEVVTGAHLTLFNGRYQGGPAILAHGVLESENRDFVEPIPILTTDSRFATVLDFEEPTRAFPLGSAFTAIDLTLGRPRLRYLLGKCPLPPTVAIGEFKLMHMTAEFSDDTTVSSTVERPCKGRG
jgi:hypothetical protein